MFIVQSYPLAVVLWVVTMLCWGSWANTQKLATKDWRFQLSTGTTPSACSSSLALAFTLGSVGAEGRGFLPDLRQASLEALGSASLGGVIFNLSNILLVAAIDIAGLAVAFPVGVGLALVIGVWNAMVMRRPFVGEPVPFGDYFERGTVRLHAIGILGGVIWGRGMSLSILASGAAGFAISYGLGQGATLVAALWGVFVWREFDHAPAGTSGLLTAMFVSFVAGLGLIVYARIA